MLRKILSILLIGVLLFGVLGTVGISKESFKTEQININFSQPFIQEEGEFITLSINEANSYLMEKGKPMLPSYIKTFVFPFKTKIKSVTCSLNNIQNLKIVKDIKPSPEPVIVSDIVSSSQKLSINYGVEPYPSNWFVYSVGCGLYDGKLSVIVKVEFNPIKYYPVEKAIDWAEGANIVIQYDNPSEQTTVRQEYQLLIIAPDEYSDELTSLITHKTARGITTKFVGLNEVYGGSGFDNAEKIKYYIKNAIEEWGISNVLLIGSYSKLPSRQTHVHVKADPEDYEIFVSDLYFADIYNATGDFCDWDYNGNGIYGEYAWYDCTGNCDKVDLHPDVYLGRLACRTGEEVTTVVNKIMNYENSQAYLQNWFKDTVVIGGDSFEDNGDINEGERMNEIITNLMTDFTATALNVTNGKLTQPLMGVQNIKNAIDSGCGFVDFAGHGNTNVWATHPHLNFNTWVPTPTPPGGIYSVNVETLANGDELPIVVVEACDTAKFDQDPNCFNWAFMYNSNGGAIGTFGATGLGWGYVGSSVEKGGIGKMELDTFKAYKIDSPMTLGEMWAKALNRYIKVSMKDTEYKCVEEWELFGDPTLQIGQESGAPLKPAKPSGLTTGVPGTEYTYSSSTTDPENDQIYYMFDWGDGTNSGWIGPYDSGKTVQAKHTWSSKKTYQVKVQAKDEHEKFSEWSDSLSVTIPRFKNIDSYDRLILNLMEQFFGIFPIFFPFLQKLLNRLE